MSQSFTSGGQSIGASASATVLPMNNLVWFPLGLTGLISIQSKGFSRVFSNTTVQKHQFFGAQLSLYSNSHIRLTLCDPLDCSTPGLPVHHQLLEFTQTHVHWVSDAIQPYHPLSSPSPLAFNLSQIQGLFKWSALCIRWSIGVSASTSVLPMNTQDWFPLGWTGWISLQSKGLSRVFSNTTVQKHQFFGAQLSLYSNSHIHTWLLIKP